MIEDRPNLSTALSDRLRAMIVNGDLHEGDRLNEVHLAAQLGVSRTPLREALTRLVGEGAVTALPRHGFYVCPMSVDEVEQLYPMRAMLDPEALRLSGYPSVERMQRLRALNIRLQAARIPEQVVDLDDEWHRLLIMDCPNHILLGLIDQFIWRTRRYELGLMRDSKDIIRAGLDHDMILDALDDHDMEAACTGLRHNMQSGVQPILDWLKNRPS